MTSDGTKIQQWQAIGGLDQQWRIATLADGNDEIVNAYSGLLLDDTNASTNNGNPIQQWQANGGVSEQWNLLAAGTAPAVTNYIVNADSGLAADKAEFLDQQRHPHSGSTHLGPEANQQWTFVQMADGKGLIVNAASGKVARSLDQLDY